MFRNHYCQATPCSPARASLLTGLYQLYRRVVRNGTPLDRRQDNLARMVRRHGHDPVLFGYTDQTRDPRETAGDAPWVATFEGYCRAFEPMPAAASCWTGSASPGVIGWSAAASRCQPS